MGLLSLAKRAFGLRRTTPNLNTGSGLWYWPNQPSLNEQTAYTVAAYWCCVRVICETIAQMPWRVNRRTAGGAEVADQHPADNLLYYGPHGAMEAATWRELMLRHCLTWGNAYCEIDRDASNQPRALWPIDPCRVTPEWASGDNVIYRVQQDQGGEVLIPGADMLHFRGMGEELAGWSILTYGARTLRLSMRQEESMDSQMENGARISGILSPPGGGTLPSPKKDTIEKEWNAANTGAHNHGKVYLLSHGLEYKPLAMPNTDAQLLESRTFSVLDICRLMRVPPHLAYDLSRATFSNISHQHIEFLIHTLAPWIVKFEQQANKKLISLSTRRQYFTKMNQNAVLRMSPDQRADWYHKMHGLGVYNTNEIRDLEDMNDIGSDGDIRLVPVNMQTLERAGQEPEPEPIMPQAEGIEGNGRNRSLRRNS